jgi:hypothetical protein
MKLQVIVLLIISMVFPSLVYSQYPRHVYHRNYAGPHPRYSYGPTGFSRYGNGRISPGAAAAIGIGAGVVGYVIGRSTAPKQQPVIIQQQDDTKIQCREFPMIVLIENKRREVMVMKCRVGPDGDWKLPN